MKEISWKQFFTIICIELCKESPTIRELSEIMGSSHQNVKQIILKLERKGFVSIETDPLDKRKQRISLNPLCREFCRKNDELTTGIMNTLFNGISEEQLQKLAETITATREELFSAQQDRGRLDSDIEERNKELERLNDEMQKSKSARLGEEAALVRLKLQISNLEKERKQAEMKKEEKKVETEAPKDPEIKTEEKKPEEMIEEFPDDIFTGNIEEVNLDDDD